jgi:adenylosuccinate synthase
MRRGVIVQGLGFGDEGKGATVDFLTRELSAELVVRYSGGSQAGHNVVLPDGRSHTFSQFGAGTLAGAATYLGRQMIIHPRAMHREAAHLFELTGEDPFQLLQIHPQALVTTVYHQELNRLRELARGAKRHGSCGHGIGETRRYWLKYGSDAIFAADLHDDESLEPKLELLRQRALLELQEFIAAVPPEESFRTSIFRESTAQVACALRNLGRPLELSATIPAANTTIFEGAQGILLDEWRGFHPHTTWSTVTLQPALDLAEEIGIDELCTLGLTRAYLTRHGAGPMPTFDADFDARMSDPGNPRNPWQGGIRFGWLDLVLLRYAANAAGGQLDGIVVNGLDQLADDRLKVCTAYQNVAGTRLADLPVAPMPSLAAQEKLTALLENITPVYEQLTKHELCQDLASELASLAISGHGRTWQERTLHDLRFRSFANVTSDIACNDLEKSPC